MKKLIILLIIIGIGLVLVFGGKLLKNTGLTNDEMVSKGFDWVTGKGTDEIEMKGKLSLLSKTSNTDDGYYYFQSDAENLLNGKRISHLMYIDFATHQEIYLCSNSGCNHNTESCSSVFLENEVPSDSSILFIWNNKIFILSKQQDQDGVAALGVSTSSGVEGSSSILYCLNLDGTSREKIYTFDSNLTVEDFVVGDENGLYFVTKKVSANSINGNSYQTSSEKNLVYLDVKTKKEKKVFSMDFNDDVEWDVIGCSDKNLILHGIDFGKKVSQEEKHSENNEVYKNSYDVFKTLNVENRELKEIYRIFAAHSRSYVTDEKYLYFSKEGDGEVIKIDLKTGEKNSFVKLSQNGIYGIIGDKIMCYEYSFNNKTLYFVDKNTGKISHSNLVNKTVGRTLDIIAESKTQVLVVYDSDVNYHQDGSYETKKEYCGLISKEDLYKGNRNFTEIKMINNVIDVINKGGR